MKVIEFLRVSTLEQGRDDKAGLPRQKEANKRTIERHNLTCFKTITLKDVSGTSVLHAPEVHEMLSLIKSVDVGGIVIADWDRLIRPDNFRDFALLQHFKETNTLIYLPDHIVDLNTQSGFLMGGFQSIISGNELSQIKKRMSDAKEEKRKLGQHPNNLLSLPFGVSYDYHEKKFYYNEKINAVKNLFDLFYNKGIRNYCELEGLTGIKHRTIRNLLTNETYIGYRTYDEKRETEKTDKPGGRQGDRKKVKRLPDNIIRVKVLDPAIDEDVFRKVQEIISKKNTEYHRKMSKAGERFLYSGFLRCGICGERIYSTSGGRNHKRDYYYCKSKNYLYVKKHGSGKCCLPYMAKEVIEGSVTSFVSEKLIEKNYLKRMIKSALSRSNYEQIRDDVDTLREAIKKIEGKRSRIVDLYTDEVFPREELYKKAEALNQEMQLLKMKLVNLDESALLKKEILINQNFEPIVSTLVEFSYWTPKEKRTFLRSQLPEFSITGSGIVGFTLNVCKLGNRMGRGSLRQRA